jgi:rfaE bifunctional protein kinase chain/domain
MNEDRFDAITRRYGDQRIAVVGDFCLDRYLEIDADRKETSLETGLPVHNVVDVRSQPGGAGTILNNLVALGVGEIFPVGFCGDDGEGFELLRALRALRGVRLAHFITTPLRQTFTYAKPLVLEGDRPPRELNRLDFKNWTPTPREVEDRMVEATLGLLAEMHGMILLDQVDVAETGVVTRWLLESLTAARPGEHDLIFIADSRRGLRGFPPVIFKMNARELAALSGVEGELSAADVKRAAADLARRNGRPVFVTLAEEGIVGAAPDGAVEHMPALPVRGPIDIVGAGDAVTANLTAALAAGADLREALELANAAASIVIHQLGTTGTASVEELREWVVS